MSNDDGEDRCAWKRYIRPLECAMLLKGIATGLLERRMINAHTGKAAIVPVAATKFVFRIRCRMEHGRCGVAVTLTEELRTASSRNRS